MCVAANLIHSSHHRATGFVHSSIIKLNRTSDYIGAYIGTSFLGDRAAVANLPCKHGQVMLYPFSSPCLRWPSIPVIKLHYRDTRCLLRGACVCVCSGWHGGVTVKDGVPLALYCSQHTLMSRLSRALTEQQCKFSDKVTTEHPSTSTLVE